MSREQPQNKPEQAKPSKTAKSQKQDKPVSETEKRFMNQPNKLVPRALLHPQQLEERAWKYLSTTKRKGLDPLEQVADEETLRGMRYTLEQSGAFQIPDADKENVADEGLTEEQRLQKWTKARKVKATAAPCVPMRPLLGHQMAAKARLRRTPQKRIGGRLERPSCDAARRPPPAYEADLTQFVILKRPKRKSQDVEEARKGE